MKWMKGSCLLVLGMLAFASLPAAGTEVEVVRSGLAHDSLYEIVFDVREGLATGDHGVLLKTTDGGETWEESVIPRVDQALLSASLAGDQALVVGQEGVVLTRNGDGAWTRRESGTQERLLSVAMRESGLAFAVGGFGTVLRSEDFGRSWETLYLSWEDYIDDPGYEPHLYAVVILPDDRVLMAGEFGLILDSTDRGATWLRRNISDESIFGMKILGDGQGLAVGQNGYITRTADAGLNWERATPPNGDNLLDVWLSGEGPAVAVGIRALYRSGDGGVTWNRVDHPLVARAWYSALASGATLDGRERVYAAGILGTVLAIDP